MVFNLSTSNIISLLLPVCDNTPQPGLADCVASHGQHLIKTDVHYILTVINHR